MSHRTLRRPSARGFTLVELMVALSGGLFIALAVFALASDTSRFYKRESRLADATLAGLTGFERLRADIARAGFLGSPNVIRDPRVCGDPLNSATWPQELRRLASVRIEQNTISNNTLTANGLAPDRITLTGSYASSDEFPIWNVQQSGAQYFIYLQRNTGPLGRMNYNAAAPADQTVMLQNIFGTGRGLRILDQTGEVQFATIAGVQAGAQPAVIVNQQPALTFRTSAGSVCGLKGNVTGAVVNVVNIVQYQLVENFGTTNPAYAPLYDDGDSTTLDTADQWAAERTDLIRHELDTTGTVIQGSQELVAEYAVDLRFGLTVVNNVLGTTDPSLTTLTPELGAAQIPNWAGDALALAGNPNQGPHRIRSVRVRMSTRSREADRDAPIVGASGTPIAPGLYRMQLPTGPAGAPTYARVRTLQADVTLHNQVGRGWF